MQRARVRRLAEQLSNQIAAGEVVARPASVVKELVENALDAGAQTIRVEIEGGGVILVRVVDDGIGIHRDDVALALERHATSKIESAEDLVAIATLGFRGEALPSIASVSRLSLFSRCADDDAATSATVEADGEVRIAPCAAAPGTTVEVRELFYNVPARRKFLRSVATESAHVTDVVRNAALAHPEVQLELVRDGRMVRRFLRMQSVAERVRDVLHDMTLIEWRGARGPLLVEAFLSSPERARAGAGGLHLFVNRRPVHDRGIARAIATAYGERLERGRYPVGALFIEMPAELVDVNVHPQKAEVRFAHARALTDSVHALVSEALAARAPVAEPKLRAPDRSTDRSTERPSAEPWEWRDSGAVDAPLPIIEPPPPDERPAMQSLGLLRDRFLVCADRDGVLVVAIKQARMLDLRSRALAELARGRLIAQRLLFPIARSLPETVDLESSERLGFDVRRTGPSTIAVHAVPKVFASAPAEKLLDALIAARSSDEPAFVDTLSRLTAEAAPPLSESEAHALVQSLAAQHALSPKAVLAAIRYADLDDS